MDEEGKLESGEIATKAIPKQMENNQVTRVLKSSGNSFKSILITMFVVSILVQLSATEGISHVGVYLSSFLQQFSIVIHLPYTYC